MGAHIQSLHTPYPPWWGQKVKNSFLKVVMLHIKLKGIHIQSLHTPSTPGVGSKGQKLFSESSLVAYQIKGNGAPCKHIFCPCTHPQSPGWVKRFFFLKLVMLDIKLEENEA